ncbi:hypothetical protein QWZ08_05860 [Ferruginibacter paludis]|uniref:hypothetical protein n=1 Tax=Ferruginibacter TaxID=1004303 RepID=UPI0025B2C206|nr:MULTISPECIES: hypothetical protein [Ferruginibacter]MDB5277376.1 hypothetical protein [Ferruginibacter sp.]MDN3655136.1 hypothetical protein [Ferruginibacter paludis]
MHFLFFRFKWSEWDKEILTDSGTGFYFTNHPPAHGCDTQRTIRLFINKPATAAITIDEITEITKMEYELETGKPFHL